MAMLSGFGLTVGGLPDVGTAIFAKKPHRRGAVKCDLSGGKLALEAEQTLKESRPTLRLIDHNPLLPPAART